MVTTFSAMRIIPAYAGSTQRWRLRRIQSPDHPRIRGEHFMPARAIASFLGSSPHTRGAHQRRRKHRREGRDHPRIRGEHLRRGMPPPTGGGSSPHTRGARRRGPRRRGGGGIIPAYAGSTLHDKRMGSRSADHPRIRGEHVLLSLSPRRQRGSSPHTRGALD